MWIDILIISLCVLAVIGAVALSIINKKKGKSSCGCNCANCSCCTSKNSCKTKEQVSED